MVRETSIEAYKKIKKDGLLSKARFQIYEILFEHGPLTRSEIDQRLKFGCYKSHVSARLCEMREMGVVAEMGERKCSVSKNNVILWDVTANLPLKFEKAKKHKCKFCKGSGYITEQQIRLF